MGQILTRHKQFRNAKRIAYLENCLIYAYQSVGMMIIYSPLVKFEVSEHHLVRFSGG
jgi:hypothetical protein